MEENKVKIIRQPYVLTMSKHHLDIHEFRVMTRIIEALQPAMEYDKDRTAVKTKILEVQKTLKSNGDIVLHLPTSTLFVKGSENYTRVKKALNTLEEKKIYIRNKDSIGNYETNARLIMKHKYYLNNQMVAIYLDHDLVPDMLALAKNYSQCLVEVVFYSSSVYIARLYQFISHWKDKTTKPVMIDELRDWLNLGDKYKKAKDFRKRILEPAAMYLKERADVWFEIDKPIKAGKSITGYMLKIYIKPSSDALKIAYKGNVKDILQMSFGLDAHHLKKLENIINRPELYRHIIKKLKNVYDYINKGNVKNIKGYVVTALLNEFCSNSNQSNSNQLELSLDKDFSNGPLGHQPQVKSNDPQVESNELPGHQPQVRKRQTV
jgi:plasmid replication initiation protein